MYRCSRGAPNPWSSPWPATIANERFAGAPSRPQVAERERSSAERLDGATANRRIVWRRPISTESKSCGKMEPNWRPTVTADDDTDKRGVSDPPIRGGAMIATQEGGRSRPDHLFNGERQWRKGRRPFTVSHARYRVAIKALDAAPEVPDRHALVYQGKRDGGGQDAPCLLAPLLAPSSIRESKVRLLGGASLRRCPGPARLPLMRPSLGLRRSLKRGPEERTEHVDHLG